MVSVKAPERIQPGIKRMHAAAPGQLTPTADKDVVWFRCESKRSHGEAAHSPVKFFTVKLIARVGTQPVLFQIRSSEIVNAEAEYNAFKLSCLDGSDGEGKLLLPPPPYFWSEDGEPSFANR